ALALEREAERLRGGGAHATRVKSRGGKGRRPCPPRTLPRRLPLALAARQPLAAELCLELGAVARALAAVAMGQRLRLLHGTSLLTDLRSATPRCAPMAC